MPRSILLVSIGVTAILLTGGFEALQVQVSASETAYSELADQAYNEEENTVPTTATAGAGDEASTSPAHHQNEQPDTVGTERLERSADAEQEHAVEESSYPVEEREPEAPEDVRTEYGTELTAEEATEGLDADEVHQEHDAEDGGDYTEYAANPDDEDDFGEDLPEDVGGTVSELANDQHEALAGPYGEVSTGADDSEAAAVAAEGEPETVLEAIPVDSAYTSNDRLISPLTSARSPATDAPHGNPTKIAGGAEVTTGGTPLTFSRV